MPSNVDFGLWILHWKLYPLLYSCNSSKDNCIKNDKHIVFTLSLPLYFSWQRKSKGERDCSKEPGWKWQNRTPEGGRAHRLHWWAVQCSWYWLFTRISTVLYPQIQQIWVKDIQCSTQRNIWWCLMDKQMETLSSVYQNMVKHRWREEGPSIDARNGFHNKGDSHRGWFFFLHVPY